MLFTEEKIANQLQEIKQTIHRKKQEIPTFKFLEGDCKGAAAIDFDDKEWAEFSVGDFWGGYDVDAWFRATVPVPESWKDEKVSLRFLVGPRDGGGSTAETLLYVNGSPLQGIDVWHEEAWIPPEHLKHSSLHIALKAWSGVLDVPDRRRFKKAELVLIDETTEKFYYLADTVRKAIQELDENDLRRSELVKHLNQSFLFIDFLKKGSDEYYQSIAEAYRYLKTEVDKLGELEELKPKVVALGHSHIDMAWLWRLCHTREKASRTFSTVLHLMRQYPEYRYIHTSPQLYQYLKEDYPDIFEKVKEKISSGEWEITGGMWIEPDTNVPSGESLIRQILFGKRFMKEEFGVETNVVWLPDVFGYTWALPQIMKKSGIEYFMTTKISWSQYNRFPYDTFNWRGIDGTGILTHFITTPEDDSVIYTYNGMVEPSSVKGIWDSYKQKDINDELLLAFGWGDGGGGPTKEMIESAKAMKNLPGMPEVEIGKAEPYFERLGERMKKKDLPVWDGELYLEYHRGTYTSQAALKKANREAEIIYHRAELFGVMHDLLTGQQHYKQEELNRGWEKLLLNQFHDILPGSSIRQVNEDARTDYAEVRNAGKNVQDEAVHGMLNQVKTEKRGVAVFNSLPIERSDYISLPLSEHVTGETVLAGPGGKEASGQVIEENGERKLLVKADSVPSLGYETFTFEHIAPDETSSVSVRKDHLENDFYQIKLNAQGQIISIYDKENGREVLAEQSRANVFQAFEDKPMKFDAWDIDLYYQEKMREISNLTNTEVIEEGPLRGSLKLTWKFYDSTIVQTIRIYKDSRRIDFDTEIDWQEQQTLLKTAFPVDIRATSATYDIQFGNIERPTHWNTSWDYAKFETVGHKWVDLSEGNYGVSLLNDCKYGHDVKDNVIRLTLIKSAISPDETADRGSHSFTYSLFPHSGSWKENGVVETAYALNDPLLGYEVAPNTDGKLPIAYQFADISHDNVWLETVKKEEDGQAAVIRLYEYKQHRNQDVKVRFGEQIKKAVECNMIEEEIGEADYKENQISFSIKPYEVKTFKIWF